MVFLPPVFVYGNIKLDVYAVRENFTGGLDGFNADCLDHLGPLADDYAFLAVTFDADFSTDFKKICLCHFHVLDVYIDGVGKFLLKAVDGFSADDFCNTEFNFLVCVVFFRVKVRCFFCHVVKGSEDIVDSLVFLCAHFNDAAVRKFRQGSVDEGA